MKRYFEITLACLLLSCAAYANSPATGDARDSINDTITIKLTGDALGSKLDDYSIHKHPEDNQYHVTKVQSDPALDCLTQFNIKGQGDGYVSIHLLVAKNWTQQCNITLQDSAQHERPKVSVMPECASNWRISDVIGENGQYQVTISTH